ncbi:MAG: hypothetical protein ACTHKF_00800 [Candidatus Nitrosocosmicus sp.]
MYGRKAKKVASAHTCSVLKQKLKSAKTKTARSAALGNFARHGCAARSRRRKRK